MATAKTLAITNWVNTHPAQEFSTTKLAQELGVSLPTLLSYIKNNSHRFNKVKHGVYQVMAVATVATINASQMTPTVVIESSSVNNDDEDYNDDLQTTTADRPFEW